MLKSPAWFDFPTACLGAVVSGAIVGWINFDHGVLPALIAALKQACYTFLAVGLLAKFCRWLTLRPVALRLAHPWLTRKVSLPGIERPSRPI